MNKQNKKETECVIDMEDNKMSNKEKLMQSIDESEYNVTGNVSEMNALLQLVKFCMHENAEADEETKDINYYAITLILEKIAKECSVMENELDELLIKIHIAFKGLEDVYFDEDMPENNHICNDIETGGVPDELQ